MRREIKIDGDFENFIVNKRKSLSDVFVVLLHGSRMKTLQDLHHELAASFQFPSYYGENWNAFDECINDLSWLREKKFIAGIMDYEKILSEYEYDKKYLKDELNGFEICLNGAVEEWHGNFEVYIQENKNVFQLMK